jgi:hypothetical protein
MAWGRPLLDMEYTTAGSAGSHAAPILGACAGRLVSLLRKLRRLRTPRIVAYTGAGADVSLVRCVAMRNHL